MGSQERGEGGFSYLFLFIFFCLTFFFLEGGAGLLYVCMYVMFCMLRGPGSKDWSGDGFLNKFYTSFVVVVVVVVIAMFMSLRDGRNFESEFACIPFLSYPIYSTSIYLTLASCLRIYRTIRTYTKQQNRSR
ncbi:hypothetical protein GGS21DRAFT_340021 [Xylaria nigripes]|nr:hypothetical protein GGS21DRAFT_340021 [Xylaria nigripes]